MRNKDWDHYHQIDLDAPWARFTFAAGFIVIHLMLAWCFSHGQTGPWPHGSFLYFPPSFTDGLQPLLDAKTLDPYFAPINWMGMEGRHMIANYFPFAYLWFWALHTFLVCQAMTFLVVLATARWAWKRFGWQASLILLTCFPMIFGLDRGNPDVLIGCAVLVSTTLMLDGNAGLAAVLLSFAIAMKGYPGLLLVLFWAQGYRREAIGSALLALGLNLDALCFFNGGPLHNLEGLLQNLSWFNRVVTHDTGNMGFSADPFNALRILSLGLHKGGMEGFLSNAADRLVQPYALGWLILGLGIWQGFSSDISHARRLLWVSVAMMWFPNVCADYKLICLLPSLFWICADKRMWTWRDYSIFICLLYVLIPKNYLFLFSDVSASCLIDPLLLTLALVAA